MSACDSLFCSPAIGLRIGAIPGLIVGSLEEYKDLYKITIYENEPEEYTVFSYFRTKEGDMIIPPYAPRYGEVITKTIPSVREQFDRRDQFAIAHPKRIKEPALARKLSELAEAAGLVLKCN